MKHDMNDALVPQKLNKSLHASKLSFQKIIVRQNARFYPWLQFQWYIERCAYITNKLFCFRITPLVRAGSVDGEVLRYINR